MKFLRTFNKEQITVAAAVAFGGLLLAYAMLGGRVAAVDVKIPEPERAYVRPPSRFAEFVQEDFLRIYWPGNDIWKPEYAARLPVPQIRPPEPRPDDLAAPLFRPAPASEVYNKLSTVKAKYPCLAAGAPAIPEAEAPPAAEVEAVKKIEEPVGKPLPDRRAERESQYYVLELDTGTKLEGESVDDAGTNYIVKDRKTGQRLSIPKSKVRKEVPNWTNEEKYQRKSRGMKPGPQEAAERLKLAQWCCDDVGMIPEAEAEAKRAIELKKDFLEAYLLLGRIYIDQGNVDGALAVYEAGIAGGAGAADLHYEIGRCYRMLASMEEPWLEAAQGAFERAKEASPRHQKSIAALARTLLDRGQFKAAADLAADFFQKLGSSPDTRPAEKVEGVLVRGLALLRMGDLEKSRAELAEAIKQAAALLEALKQEPAPGSKAAPPSPETIRAAEAQHAEALNGQAVLDALEGKYPQAAAGFIGAVKVNQYLTDAWTNLGALLLLAGRWADAEAVYAAAAQRDPLSSEALLGSGIAQAMGGKPDGAAAIEKALKVEPKNAAARAALAFLKLRTPGMDDLALDLYKEALRNDYHYMPAYYGASTACLRAARKARIEGEMEKDETRSPELFQKARELRLMAEMLLKKLKAMDATRADTLVALGCVYALLDRPDEALDNLRGAAQILQQKNDPLLHYTLGFVEYWHPASDPDEKRLEKALGSFTRCASVELNPQDAFGAEVVKEVKRVVEDIQDWRVTSLRVDDRFEREPPSNPVVGGGWSELENNGIDITVESTPGQSGRCRFSGQQAKEDMGITILERQIPAENFHALELTFYPAKVQGAEFGVSIYYNQQGSNRIGFHVGFNDKIQARYHPNLSYPNDMHMKDMVIVRWSEIKTAVPDPAQITLRIARAEKDRRPVWNVSFWDPSKGDWVLAQKEVPAVVLGGAATRQWTVALWGRTMRGSQYTLELDNVRIYERTRK